MIKWCKLKMTYYCWYLHYIVIQSSCIFLLKRKLVARFRPMEFSSHCLGLHQNHPEVLSSVLEVVFFFNFISIHTNYKVKWDKLTVVCLITKTEERTGQKCVSNHWNYVSHVGTSCCLKWYTTGEGDLINLFSCLRIESNWWWLYHRNPCTT